MPRLAFVVGLLTLLMPLMSHAAQIYNGFPDVVHADERYVIYSHGLIVEGEDSKPVHPEFGVYDFPAVTQALFEGGGFNLIAHHRPKNTAFEPYVAKLESWVRRLVKAGVKPSRITLVGFSRGGALSANASSRLSDLHMNTALLACCMNGDVEGHSPLTLSGNLLSIFETSDAFGSCKALATRSETASFEEVAISTGLKHGAFYRPLPEWMTPLKAWIAKTNR